MGNFSQSNQFEASMTRKFRFVANDEVGELRHELYKRGASTQLIPPVAGLSSGGSWIQETPGLSLRCIRNVSVTEGSDLILGDDFAILDKATRQTTAKNIFHDSNLLGVNQPEKTVDVKPSVSLGNFARAYSMLGVFSAHWGHFVCERLLGLSTILPLLPDDAAILVPDGIDQVQSQLLLDVLLAQGKLNKIYLIPKKQSVSIGELFYSNLPVIVSNDSTWTSIYDQTIQYFANTEMNRIVEAVCTQSDGPRKIFFTRGGGSSKALENIAEVEEVYRSRGYYIFRPEDHTYRQRQVILGAAEVVSGVFGSAFFNLMFCPRVMSVSVIAPLIRCIDQIGQSLFCPSGFIYYLAEAKEQCLHPTTSFDIRLIDTWERSSP